ncbi:mechanosensitive ion channel family protein [Sphingomonas sp. PP-CC-3A-396]|uniref:mechanosensitive ion channel family protein n=1 Tax=Sphingomonas sp. PP-CC-3A-396 TaxID=2135655 RepID=UPI0010E40C8E|nr:mechanosensitive ion channel family protein [Sphingomonas sp. PP-CC-3A-396]TCQ06544.1 cyclic nucleotide-regulated small mechanosensitive ion channel [Sphingomonas sp. PP-CC-3A-396]
MLRERMSSFLLPILVLGVVAVGLLAVRQRAAPIRAVFFLTLTAILGFVLYRYDTSPLLAGRKVPLGPDGHFLRAVAMAWWFAAANLAALIADRILGHDQASREARITSDLVSGAIYIAATLIVLNFVLLLPVNGLLATSGIIAVVVGLALQNTLSDVFSGIAVGIEHPFRIGHRITLGDGVEGVVAQANWRSIRILTDGGDIATIPNSVIAKTQIVNRSFPTERRSTRLQLIRPSDEPVDHVIRILNDATLLCPDVLLSPPSSATILRLGIRTNTYAIDFFVSATSEIARAKSMLLTRIALELRYAVIVADDATTAEALINQLPLFGPLGRNKRSDLASQMRPRSLDQGDTLFREGAKDDRLYVIASGVLEITRGAEHGATTLVGRIGAGEYIGEISMLTDAPHAAGATALTTSVVYEVSRAALAPLLQGDPDLVREFERSVQRGLGLVERAIAAQAGAPAPEQSALLNRIRKLFGA